MRLNTDHFSDTTIAAAISTRCRIEASESPSQATATRLTNTPRGGEYR